MLFWETVQPNGTKPPVIRADFAEIWRAADKIVFSRTLQTPASARTRIERDFDLAMVRQLKATAGADMSVAGPDLAAQAIRAGLVDEYHLIVFPVLVGGGKRALPDNVRAGARTVGREAIRQRSRSLASSCSDSARACGGGLKKSRAAWA